MLSIDWKFKRFNVKINVDGIAKADPSTGQCMDESGDHMRGQQVVVTTRGESK